MNGSTNDPGDKNDTAAEPMQNAFAVQVAFNFDNTNTDPTQVHVWAEGTFGGLSSPTNPTTLNSQGIGIFYINTPSQSVDYEPNAGWTFKCTVGSDTTVQTIGTSTHVICVPHGASSSSPTYDLVMIASCQSCVGLGTTARQAADKIYIGLAANAKDRAGIALVYGLDVPGDDGSVKMLIQNHKGSCESWAWYFQSQYNAQGLAGADAKAVKVAGWKLKDETVAVNHAGDNIWTGLSTAKPGNNNAAPGQNVQGLNYVNAGKYCQSVNNSTANADTAAFPNPTNRWWVADHAVCLLQDGANLVLYDTSYGGGSVANTGYVLNGVTMPATNATNNYLKTDPFVAAYFLNVFDYVVGTIQVSGNEVEEFVPSTDFNIAGAAPNTLNVVWLGVQ